MDALIFREHAITRNLSEQELQRLHQHLRRVEYIGEQVICEQGQRGPGLLLAISGTMKVLQRPDDGSTKNSLLITTLAAPTVVGELELLSGCPAVCTVVAAEPVVALHLSHDEFHDLVGHGEPALTKLLQNVANVVVNRLIESNNRVLALLDPDKRNEYNSLGHALKGIWDMSTPARPKTP